MACTSRRTGGPALVRSTTSRRPQASASTNQERRVGWARSSPRRAGRLLRAWRARPSRRRSWHGEAEARAWRPGAAARASQWKTVGTPLVGEAPEARADEPDVNGLARTPPTTPLRLARAAGPRRVVAPVDREPRVVAGRIGGAHGQQVGRAQRVEHAAALVGDDERTAPRRWPHVGHRERQRAPRRHEGDQAQEGAVTGRVSGSWPRRLILCQRSARQANSSPLLGQR